MITSSLATTASCPSGDQRRQSRTFGRSLNLTSRSIFRNGFECEGIRGPAEGAWGKIDNSLVQVRQHDGLIARAFFLYASAFSSECCCEYCAWWVGPESCFTLFRPNLCPTTESKDVPDIDIIRVNVTQ